MIDSDKSYINNK